MNTGKTPFAQPIGFWALEHIHADCVRMAFAQVTYRVSPRNIGLGVLVQASKLYYMGFHEPVRRLTLEDDNKAPDRRI